jgi:hypothetical protein
MGQDTLSDAAYRKVADDAQVAGSATHVGQERRKKGLGLDPLVDPASFGVTRRSLCRFVESGDNFIMPNGVAMSIESLLDGTGSMGSDNISVALDKLKLAYDLLSKRALSRYDLQLATTMFGDTEDDRVVQRSQFEMDVKIAQQITLFDLASFDGHGNYKENPEYAIFGATFLTDADIWRYGLGNYHCALSDESIVHYLDPGQIERIYGKEVWERVRENGHDVDRNNLPTTPEMLQILLKRTHAFFFLFKENYKGVRKSWTECYGRERVIDIPRTALFPFFEAAVMGLTEGVVDLQTMEDFLREASVSESDARVIKHAVAHIPIGEQVKLPNFTKIPLKGSVFAKKRDLWPIDETLVVEPAATKEPGKKKKKMWL